MKHDRLGMTLAKADCAHADAHLQVQNGLFTASRADFRDSFKTHVMTPKCVVHIDMLHICVRVYQ